MTKASLFGLTMCLLLGLLPLLANAAEASNANLLENPDAETMMPIKDSPFLRVKAMKHLSEVPVGWGFFSLTDFGVSSEYSVSGKQSVYAGHRADADVPSGKKQFAYLLIGNTDGYDGSRAIKVVPGKKYAWSVWVRGDAGLCEVRMLVWPEDGATTSKHRKVAEPCGKIFLLPKWQLLAGEFTVPAGIERVAMGLRIPDVKAGQRIYADKATFEEYPAITPTASPAKNRIAVYNPESKYAQKEICDMLKKQGFEADLTDTLADEVLNQYDVLILTTCQNISKKDRGDLDLGVPPVDWVGSILRFADKGGGIILGHDCIGERGIWNPPLFPQICSGNGIGKNTKLQVASPSHPVMQGLPSEFEQTYFDHVEIRRGQSGEALIKDDQGSIVVAAGELSRGRIVAIGFPLCLNHRDQPTTPKEVEWKLLLNAIQWAGSAKRFTVPPIITDAKLRAPYNLRKSTLESGLLQEEQKVIQRIAQYPAPKFGRKIMWLMPYRFQNAEQIEQAVRNSKELGFTEILFQATAGHDLFYKSDLYPDCTLRKNEAFFDVLAKGKEYSDKYGMRFGVFVMGVATSRNNHHCGLFPEVTETDRELLAAGKLTMEQIEKRRGWACATHPKNQERCLKIYREIIEKFQPVAFCFDYVRYSTGYDNPCRCDYCEAKRGTMSPIEFAHRELLDFYTRANNLCKEAKPDIITGCYTMSVGSDWVFNFPFDEHYKYVSRENETPLGNVEELTMKWGRLVQKINPNCVFVPIVANYNFKDATRMYNEFKAVSKKLDELNQKSRPICYYHYGAITESSGPNFGEFIEDTASGVQKAMKEK